MPSWFQPRRQAWRDPASLTPAAAHRSIMPNQIDAFAAALGAIVGPSHVLTGVADTARYTADWRRNFPGVARAVVRPANTFARPFMPNVLIPAAIAASSTSRSE